MNAYFYSHPEVAAKIRCEPKREFDLLGVRELVRNVLDNPPAKESVLAFFALFATCPELLAGPVCGTEDSVGEYLPFFVPVVVRNRHRGVRTKLS